MAAQDSKSVTIGAAQITREIADLIRRAYSGEEHFIVEEDGLPVAALISIADYNELMEERVLRQQRSKLFEEINQEFRDEIQRRGLSEEEVMAALEETKEEVYREQYGDSR